MNPSAFSIDDFCSRYGIGRTTIYEEIRTGRLGAVKVGRRTLITEQAGQEWLRSLPKAGETRRVA
jgi:excisionase family DNA binding protein